MKVIIFVFWSVILTIGCIREQATNYKASLINNTQHSVTILFYKNGVVDQGDTIHLLQNERIQIANGQSRGKMGAAGFSSEYFGGSDDSIIVIFDNRYRVAHFGNTPLMLPLKYYVSSSLRNIANPASYKFEIVKSSRRSNTNVHEYTFVEDDYLFAK